MGMTQLMKPLSRPQNFCKEPHPRGAFTFCSSSKVSWQHSQNPLFFLGTVTGVDRGLFSLSLRIGQPSAALRGTETSSLPALESTSRFQLPVWRPCCSTPNRLPSPTSRGGFSRSQEPARAEVNRGVGLKFAQKEPQPTWLCKDSRGFLEARMGWSFWVPGSSGRERF